MNESRGMTRRNGRDPTTPALPCPALRCKEIVMAGGAIADDRSLSGRSTFPEKAS